MKTSEQLNELAAALALAQGEMKLAPKDGKSHQSKYATLTSAWEAAREPLSKHGLSVVQCPSMIEGKLVMVSRLLHKSGQWIETELSIKPAKEDAHSVGSASTYARRYAFSPLVGIVVDADDDGSGAMASSSHDHDNVMQQVRDELTHVLGERDAVADELTHVLGERDAVAEKLRKAMVAYDAADEKHKQWFVDFCLKRGMTDDQFPFAEHYMTGLPFCAAEGIVKNILMNQGNALKS